MKPTLFALLSVAVSLNSAVAREESPAPAADQPVRYELKYRFSPGQTFRYATHQDTTMDVHAGENQKIDRSKVDQKRLFTVQNINDENVARVSMQFEFIRMEMQSDELEPIVYESTMDPNKVPQIFQGFASRLRESAPWFDLKPDGTAIAASPEPGHRQEQESQKRDQDQDQARPSSFLNTMPDHPIAVGESWTTTLWVKVRLTEDHKRSISILQSFRLESVEDGIATISMHSSTTTPVREPGVRAQLVQATPRGTLTFDINRGILLRREVRHNESVLGALGPETLLNIVSVQVDELLEETPDAAPATTN